MLTNKLDKIIDYEAEFDKIFKHYQDKQLPKDDLYYQIKYDQDAKDQAAQAKKDQQKDPQSTV